MGDISLQQIITFLSDAGVLGLLVIVIWGGAKQWWVWGWIWREMKADRDRWRDIALSATNLADKVVPPHRDSGI